MGSGSKIHTLEVVGLELLRYLLLDLNQLVEQRAWMFLDRAEAVTLVSAAELGIVEDGSLDPFSRGHGVRHPLMLRAQIHIREPLVLGIGDLQSKRIDGCAN